MTRDPSNREKSFAFGTETLALPESAFLLLRDAIAERTGFHFDAPKRLLLADKLSELVVESGFTSFLEYYYALKYDDASGERTQRLIDRLAVPETYFWRQPEHFTAVASVIVPRLLAENPGRRVRIWSAASCTGEEPLSIAMALGETGYLDPRRVEIIASDASPALIDAARNAVYGERSFRQLPAALRERYFERDPHGGWRPRPRLTERVRYEVANLLDHDAVMRLGSADIVFCRNVFIYFADDTIREVVRVLNAAMPRHGYLFVGAAESLTRLGVDFELAEVGGAFVYVKLGQRAIAERRGQPLRAGNFPGQIP